MSKPYPDNQFLNGNFAPWLMEGDAFDLVVEGAIPRELVGSYFRNGSNPQYAPGAGYHWFAGDGMIHAFHFEEGRCHYRNRWVRTDRFHAERKAGRSLFGGFMGKGEPDPASEGVSGNASNTSVIWHAGKLLSLWEAGPPYELDPATLETIGVWDYDGKFKRERFGSLAPDILTAHPKLDPDTGECLAFGYSPLPPFLVYHVVDSDGKLIRSEEIEVPFASMMHDFVISAEHALFPIMPAAFDFEAVAETGSALNWQPERGSHIGILRRNGPVEDMIWIEKEASFSFHYVNAVTTGSTVVADIWHLPHLGLFPTEGLEPAPPTLHRWTIDLDEKTLVDEALDDAPAEFGRIDDRYTGKCYRHMYSLGSLDIPESMGDPEFFNCLFHYDMQRSKRIDAHKLEEKGDCFGEPQFVPRSKDAAEGDGFVLAIVYRAAENRSDLVILDAQNLAAEPLAVVRCPHRIPFGFHGNWRPAD